MRREAHLPAGTLPRDARLKLQAAAQVGSPGSNARRRAIEKAYKYIDDTYPEYLRTEKGNCDAS